MDLEIKDLAGLSEPIKKGLEVISAGMGTLYRPRAMRKEADAKAYKIEAVTRAQVKASIITSQGQALAQLEYIKTLTEGDPELFDRLRMRLIARELEGQQNVESIAEHSLKFLPEMVSDKPVSPDWRRKFFSEAENVCDKDMQELWGKVLAGEVAMPGSYRQRTLEVLKTLSRGEAETFKIACSLAYNFGEIIVNVGGVNVSDPLKKYGLHWGALMALTDSGLLHAPTFVYRQFQDLLPDGVSSMVIENNGLYLQLSGASLKNTPIPVLAFTASGRELQHLISPNPCMPYLHDIVNFLRVQLGLTVKRGTEIKQADGSTILTFDADF